MVQQPTQEVIHPRPRGPYVHRDTRYVSEYLAFAFPQAPKMFNVRLGPAPLEIREKYPQLDVERWARVWGKIADAIVVTPGALVVVEGELRRPIVAIGELVVYRELIPQTVSLARWWQMPIRTILLTPIPDPALEPVLRKLQIESVYYSPPWAEEYMHQVGRL